MHSIFIRTTKTRIRLRGCAGWFGSTLAAHVRRFLFSSCGSNIIFPGPDVHVICASSWEKRHDSICVVSLEPMLFAHMSGSPRGNKQKKKKKYSRLSLSRIPRDSLKYFEVSVPRHIRVERVRKTINWTTTFNKWIWNLTPKLKMYI